MPDQHHITGELCSSSVTIQCMHCIQSLYTVYCQCIRLLLRLPRLAPSGRSLRSVLSPSTKRVGAALKWRSGGRGRASRIPARGLPGPSAPCSGVCSRCFIRGRQRRRLLQRGKAPAASRATSAADRVAGAGQEEPRLGGSWHHHRWAQCRAHRRQPARRRR